MKLKSEPKKSKKVKDVYFLNCGRWLDRTAFLRYFEKKVLYTMRKFNLFDQKDKIAVALSGGKDSLTMLYLLNKLCSPKGQQIAAVAIDEGIPGYRNKLLAEAAKFCRKQNIPLKIYLFKKEFGFTIKDKTKQIRDIGLTNCYVCSILKRWLLNKKARELNCDIVATAHSLDDEAESILLNLFKGNPQILAKLGPATGISSIFRKDKKEKKEKEKEKNKTEKDQGNGKGFIQRVKPFYLCTTKEIILYAKLNKLPVPKGRAICPLRGVTFRVEIRNWFDHLGQKHSEVRNAVVKSFLKIMPVLKEKYKGLEFEKCRKCGFPASQEICKTCLLLEKLKS